MREKQVVVTVSEHVKDDKINQLQAEGYTVTDIAQLPDRSDNSNKHFRITAKDMSAKLGHIDREFTD